MAKYKPFDEGKYTGIFDGMYGKGAFQSGMNEAATVGRLAAEAKFAEQMYLERLRAAKEAASRKRKGGDGDNSITPTDKVHDLVKVWQDEKFKANQNNLDKYNAKQSERLNAGRSLARRPVEDLMGGSPVMTNDKQLTDWERMKLFGG